MSELLEILGAIVLILFAGGLLLVGIASLTSRKPRKRKLEVTVRIIDPEHKKLQKEKKKAEKRTKKINKKYLRAVKRAENSLIVPDTDEEINRYKFDQTKEVKFD